MSKTCTVDQSGDKEEARHERFYQGSSVKYKITHFKLSKYQFLLVDLCSLYTMFLESLNGHRNN